MPLAWACQPDCATYKWHVALLEPPPMAVGALNLSGKLPTYFQDGREVWSG